MRVITVRISKRQASSSKRPQTQVSLASIKPLAEGFAIAEVDLLGTRIAFHVAMVDPIFAQHVLGERAAAGDRQHVLFHGVVLRDGNASNEPFPAGAGMNRLET